MDAFKKKLGEKIKALRTQLGWSQEELAARVKLNRVSLSQIENGQREVSAEEVAALSSIFNTSTDILLDMEQDVEVVLQAKTARSSVKQKRKKDELRISVPQKNVEKFKEVLLYILNKVGSKANIGETVIYKLLYFIDFDFYEKYEEQLIGATYMKNHYGPTPVEFVKIVKEMEEKDLVKVTDQYFQYPRTKYLPKRKPNLDKLTPREIELVDEVINKLSDMNAQQISEYSHYDVPWLTAEEGEIIKYESVFYRTPAYSTRNDSGDTASKADIQRDHLSSRIRKRP